MSSRVRSAYGLVQLEFDDDGGGISTDYLGLGQTMPSPPPLPSSRPNEEAPPPYQASTPPLSR